MKIPIKPVLAFLLIVTFLLLFTGCPDYTESEAELVGNIKYCNSHDGKTALVYSVVWDGNEENTVFEIPDTYNGKDLVSMGAKVTGFRVESDSQYWFYNQKIGSNSETEQVNVDMSAVEMKDIVFTLKIGKNIREIRAAYSQRVPSYLVFKRESGFVMYRVLFNIECPEDNKTFYSRDGKLYKRSNDELLDEFTYYTDVKNGVEPDYGPDVICVVKNADLFQSGVFCVDMFRYMDRDRKFIGFERLYEYKSNWRITFMNEKLTEYDFKKLWDSGLELNEGGGDMAGRYMYVLCDHNAFNSDAPTNGVFVIRWN